MQFSKSNCVGICKSVFTISFILLRVFAILGEMLDPNCCIVNKQSSLEFSRSFFALPLLLHCQF